MAEEIAHTIGYPEALSGANIDLYSFWEIIVKELHGNGYIVIDQLHNVDIKEDK